MPLQVAELRLSRIYTAVSICTAAVSDSYCILPVHVRGRGSCPEMARGQVLQVIMLVLLLFRLSQKESASGKESRASRSWERLMHAKTKATALCKK